MFRFELTVCLHNAAQEVARQVIEENNGISADENKIFAWVKLSACQIQATGVLLARRDGDCDWIHPLLVHAAKIHGFTWKWEENKIIAVHMI